VPRVAAPSAIELPLVDLSALPAAGRGERGLLLAREEACRPFDLERGPLMRAHLVRLAADEHLLLISLHHIVSDAWSRGILVTELAALYEAFASGRPSPLAEPALQYADFARWQRQWLRGEALEEQLGYWRRHLASRPATLELPIDRPRTMDRNQRGGLVATPLPASLTNGLRALSRRSGTTLFMTLLAGFQALLARYAGEDDAPVGSPVAGRTRVEVERLVGFFVNTLVLRTDLGGDPSFSELLGRARETTLGAYDHQDLPFERLVEELAPRRDLRQTPLFQVMLALQNVPLTPLELPGLRLEPLEVDSGTAKLDLSLTLVEEEDGGLAGWLEYDRDLFDPATVERIAGHFRNLLTGAQEDPGRRFRSLPLLGEAEWEQIDSLSRGIPSHGISPRSRDLCVHELFEARAALAPAAPAVIAEGAVLSYGELDTRAEDLARRLQGLGVGPEVRVGLSVPRSIEGVVAILGILKAGGAWVAIDPAYPPERQAWILKDSGARVLITEGAIEVLEEGEAIPGALPGSLAYVIYTSGSTGTPKGVGVEHGAAVEHLRAAAEVLYGLTEGDRFLQTSSWGFDVTVEQILAPLATGAAVVLWEGELDPRDLSDRAASLGLTVLDLPPALLQVWLREMAGRESAPPIRRVVVGGDALPLEAARLWSSTPLRSCRLLNGYGPTEAVVTATFHDIAEAMPPFPWVPIGRPLPGRSAHVLDHRGERAPLGAPGELSLGGVLARGYLGRPDLTAERFVPDPFSGEPGARLYLTGDRVRWMPGGYLEFLGRIDQQVKVRGFRIEPGEIEAALVRHPAVAQAAVVVAGEGADRQLVGFLVARQGQAVPDAAGLRAFLGLTLPHYMAPSTFVEMPALPLTPHGKVDRRSLVLAVPEPRGKGFVAPIGFAEQIVAGIWAEVLGLDQVGVEDDFFALGGHSLLATRVQSRMREAFGVELPLRRLFDAPTVAAQAAEVEALRTMRSDVAAPPLRPVPRDGESPLSPGQERLWFLQRLDPRSSAYNLASSFRLLGRLDPAALARCLAELARRHEPLRTSFPERDGRPLQVIAPASPRVDLPLVDLGGLPAEARAAEARRLTTDAARRPFDLSRAPLLRTLLVRLAPEEHALLAVMHHIVGDGWSMGVLAREVGALYAAFLAGEPSPLAEPALQYADFAAWQRRWLEDEAGAVDGQLAYWHRQLAGVLEPPVLPSTRQRQAHPGASGEMLPFAIDPETSAGLLRLSRREDATLFMTLLAAFDVLLFALTGQTDLAVGTPVAGRRRVETEGMIGFFLNTLVLRIGLAGDPTFREVLARVRQTALEAYSHQDLPYERLVADLRGRDRSPLFRVWFVLQNTPAVPLELPGLTLVPEEIGAGEARHDLKLDLAETPRGLTGFFQYRQGLFDRAEVSQMKVGYEALLRRVVEDPGLRLGDLAETVGEVERARRVRMEGDFQRSRQQELQSLTRRGNGPRTRSSTKDV
jgi:amino acid adenylation domain-containing protein